MDDSEGVFMVDTRSFLHLEKVIDTITRDTNVEIGNTIVSTQHMLAKIYENDEHIDRM